MSNGNGNGEVKKIVELRHSYKDDVAKLEADLKARLEQELETGKKDLKDKYLEHVVDWFYGNGLNAPDAQPEQGLDAPPEHADEPPMPDADEPEPLPTDGPDPTACNECGAKVVEGDRFCSQCATPIEADEKEPGEAAVPVAGYRKVNVHAQRPVSADDRLNSWARTRRR